MVEHSLQNKEVQRFSLKKTNNKHYQHHQYYADVFIAKKFSTLVLVFVVALWNLLLYI